MKTEPVFATDLLSIRERGVSGPATQTSKGPFRVVLKCVFSVTAVRWGWGWQGQKGKRLAVGAGGSDYALIMSRTLPESLGILVKGLSQVSQELWSRSCSYTSEQPRAMASMGQPLDVAHFRSDDSWPELYFTPESFGSLSLKRL